MNAPPANLFDAVVVILIAIGFAQGRKGGMSQELIPMVKWLGIVASAPLLYPYLVPYTIRFTSLSLYYASALSYVLIAAVVLTVFGVIQKHMGKKLTGSDTFGRLEYPLGILAGIVRCQAILVVLLALLHGYPRSERPPPPSDDEFIGLSVPSMSDLHRIVFDGSMLGPYIRLYLNDQLLQQTEPKKKGPSASFGPTRR